MADYTKKICKNLADKLTAEKVPFEMEGDTFYIFEKDENVPYATFLIVGEDRRITYFTALDISVKASRLEDMLIAINFINDALDVGRLYLDVNDEGNALFYDQYMLTVDGSISSRQLKYMLKNTKWAINFLTKVLGDINDKKITTVQLAASLKELYGYTANS